MNSVNIGMFTSGGYHAALNANFKTVLIYVLLCVCLWALHVAVRVCTVCTVARRAHGVFDDLWIGLSGTILYKGQKHWSQKKIFIKKKLVLIYK
jgi:hypothetical protein